MCVCVCARVCSCVRSCVSVSDRHYVCVFVCVFVCECMCDGMCKCARGRAGACERCVKIFVALVLLHSVSVWVCAFFLCI